MEDLGDDRLERKNELKKRMIDELSVDTLNMLIDFELSRAGQEEFPDCMEENYTNLVGEIVQEIIDDAILNKSLKDARIIQ